MTTTVSTIDIERPEVHPDTVLDVSGLTVQFRSGHEWLTVVENVSFSLARGRTLGLVGESGSGKTVTSQAVMGLTKFVGGRVSQGRVLFGGEDLVGRPESKLREIRGNRIGMIFQQPNRSLNPAYTVGDQIAESARKHLGISRSEAWNRAVAMLERVGITKAKQRAKSYPHEFSGGMCQRVMIATALVCEPTLLIADEPTTALDVTVQRTILDLLREIQRETDIGILFISHDLGVIAEMCQDVAVMYAGQVVEHNSVDKLFAAPQHPYTSALLGAIPRGRKTKLRPIRGIVPAMDRLPPGCRFSDRCDHVQDRCRSGPIELEPSPADGLARCIRMRDIDLPGSVVQP